LRYLSVCSGIEAATAAWHPLGWSPAAFSEIEPFPRAVLAHHYADVPCHGDFTTIGADEYGPIDLLVGGTPCQSFSVAGLRGGLGDDRGNLALEYLRLADRTRPRWLVWENVPGVLSSNGGRDFGAILGGMVELGYSFSYRVLDAQFFGVPQRRRRVFVVGHLGDWRRAAAVLFERHSLSGHPAPRREKGQNAPTIPSRSSAGGGLGTDFDCDGGLIPSTGDISHCLNAGGMGRQDYETETLIAHSLRADGFDASEDGTGRGTPLVPVPFDTTQITSAANYSNPKAGDPCHPLASGAHPPAVCFTAKDYGADASDISPTLRSGSHSGSHANGGVMPAVAFNTRQDPIHGAAAMPIGAKDNGNGLLQGSAVRRLTPRECERLQGFQDDYTLVPYRGKPAADGPRYKALGNSMAVPVMRWIGERIEMVEAIQAESLAA
jgi:DNA (cytosine-5)-methyltransferase 1